ncbi:MAG: hypothetical protein AAGF22_11225, partial [Pseudomonadota bacterium]
MPGFALDLSREGLTLYRKRRNGKWDAIESAGLAVGSVGLSLRTLREAARVSVPADLPIEVWLPPDQVTLHHFSGTHRPPTSMLEEQFAGVSLDDAGFVVDLDAAPWGTVFPVAVAPTTTLTETRDFLEPHGFKIEAYTLQYQPEGMAHTPRFALPTQAQIAWPKVAAFAATAALLLGGAGWLGWQVLGNPGGAPREVATLEVQQIALPPGPALALEAVTTDAPPDDLPGPPLGPTLNAIATAPEGFA